MLIIANHRKDGKIKVSFYRGAKSCEDNLICRDKIINDTNTGSVLKGAVEIYINDEFADLQTTKTFLTDTIKELGTRKEIGDCKEI